MVALFILFRHNTACEYSWLCASKRQDAAVALPPWQSGETERGATACQSPAASLPSTSSVVWLRLRANLLSTHPTVQRQGRRRWSDGTQTQKETRRQREREEKGEGRKRNAALFLKRAHTHTHIYIYLFVGHKRIWIHICRAGRIGWPQRLWGRRCHRAARAVWRFKTRAFLARWTRHIDAKELANYHAAEERCFATAGGCSGGWMPPVASFLACNM